MNDSGFYLGPDRALTNEELEALKSVKAGLRISQWDYTKLEVAELIEKGLGGWKLSAGGEHRLRAGK